MPQRGAHVNTPGQFDDHFLIPTPGARRPVTGNSSDLVI
jgi:hypothetical protein